MAATDGLAAARLALFAALAEAPWTFDFFQALRRIEGVSPELPRLGMALRPGEEPVRLSQEASMAFALKFDTNGARAPGSALPAASNMSR